MIGVLAEGLMGNVPCHQHPLYAILMSGPCANTCRLERSNHQHTSSPWQSRLDLILLDLIIHGGYSCFFPLTHYVSQAALFGPRPAYSCIIMFYLFHHSSCPTCSVTNSIYSSSLINLSHDSSFVWLLSQYKHGLCAPLV